MCPCPFCTALLILLSPLFLLKGPRKWVKAKIKRHHHACETCQEAEHTENARSHTKCTCTHCTKKGKK